MVKIKIIVVGASQVGKTMLVSFLRKSRVTRYIPTIGVDLQIHTNKGVEYHIWDTSGIPAYNHVIRTFFRKANVLVLVYNNEENLIIDIRGKKYSALINKKPFVAGGHK